MGPRGIGRRLVAPARFVFVLGTGRSGSTLVEELLCRHPDVGFVSNLDDRLARFDLAGRWNQRLYRRVPPSLTRKGRLRFAPSEAYRVLARSVSPMVCRPSHDLTEADLTPWLERRFGEFFRRRAAAQRRDVFLHKFTGWPRARLIQQVFPDARFVHVVRDGRAVASSWLQMPWWLGHLGPEAWRWGPLPAEYEAEWDAAGRSFVLLAGLAWKILIDAFEEAREAVPADRWLEVCYEDVVSDPERHLVEVASFAGLGPHERLLAAVRGAEFDARRAGAYEAELGDDAVRLLTGSLKRHLERFGYVC
jgi:hypothetical protein